MSFWLSKPKVLCHLQVLNAQKFQKFQNAV